MRVLAKILTLIVLVVVGAILALDPPPLRLREENEFVLSVAAPTPDNSSRHPIESGIACEHKLEAATSGILGRPVITFFDWLKRQAGKVPERDYRLFGNKPHDRWAIKVDRPTNTFCYQRPSSVEVGLTDPYCGPKIIREDANHIVAVEDRAYEFVRVVVFDKKNYTVTMTAIDQLLQGSASLEYLQCR